MLLLQTHLRHVKHTVHGHVKIMLDVTLNHGGIILVQFGTMLTIVGGIVVWIVVIVMKHISVIPQIHQPKLLQHQT